MDFFFIKFKLFLTNTFLIYFIVLLRLKLIFLCLLVFALGVINDLINMFIQKSSLIAEKFEKFSYEFFWNILFVVDIFNQPRIFFF